MLADKAYGEYPTDFVYSDLDIASIEALAPTQIHRDVDLTVIDADTQGKGASSNLIVQASD